MSLGCSLHRRTTILMLARKPPPRNGSRPYAQKRVLIHKIGRCQLFVMSLRHSLSLNHGL